MRTPNKPLARILRRKATATEKTLWKHLRNRKVANTKFRRQQCFGPYVLDFYCAELKLNVEIDGGQHDLPDHRLHDQARTDFLMSEGVRTIRFWNSQIRANVEGVLERLRMEIEHNRPPHLDPLPSGEREGSGVTGETSPP
ncbi:MAG: endonuclease domain-containing protein [Lentisphaerae bacterium]|nr:endonuclease domain-containing protein [Lentisphaerota bacterium]